MHNWCYSLCDNSLKHQLAVCLASRKLYNIIILSIVGTLIIYAPVGMHYRYRWISLHYLDLFIKFHRVNPIVIASAIGYIFASTRQQAVEIIIYNSLVGGCWHKPNDMWIAPDIIFAYSSGAVSRSIIANNNLYRQPAFLHQYRVESARYAVMLVVCNYDHRNQAIVFHLYMLFRYIHLITSLSHKGRHNCPPHQNISNICVMFCRLCKNFHYLCFLINILL